MRVDEIMFGYHGRYLRVDLTSCAAEWLLLPESVLRRFIGGVGLASWLIHREAPPGVDPSHQRVRAAAIVLPADAVYKDAAREELKVRPGLSHARV